MTDFANLGPLINGYREAVNYGDYSKLIKALREGNPEILSSIEIRNLLADRIEKKPERGRGANIGSKKQDEGNLQLVLLMGRYIALGFAKHSNSESNQSETAASLTAKEMHKSESSVINEWKSFQNFKQETLKRKLSLLPERKPGIDAGKYSGLSWGWISIEMTMCRAAFIHNHRVKPNPTDIDKLLENYLNDSTDLLIQVDVNTECEQLLLGPKWLKKLVPDIKSKENLTKVDNYYIWLANWGQ